ncbi:MAG: imidazole glycerol phosphate synthase subunit HisH [Candidatus Micrarchaeota archaeon]
MNFVIIDYGAGNVINVANAFKKIGVVCSVSKNESKWKNADALVLPGVGSFGAAMRDLSERSTPLKNILTEDGIPFLGICLGMQILMDESEESSGVSGLGVIGGKAKRFSTHLPVPQIGWNEVLIKPTPLFEGVENFFAYFVHSYYCEPDDKKWISSTTEYGLRFASAFTNKNVFATQFHPEKSGEVGLRILENFVKEVKR